MILFEAFQNKPTQQDGSNYHVYLHQAKFYFYSVYLFFANVLIDFKEDFLSSLLCLSLIDAIFQKIEWKKRQIAIRRERFAV